MDTYIDSAAFSIHKEITEFFNDGRKNTHRLRCASLLKPLYCWAALEIEPYSSNYALWEKLASQAITVSSNKDTTEIWETAKPAHLLANLRRLTDQDFQIEHGETRWGRVLIDAQMVAHAYAQLLRDTQSPVSKILGWMGEVPAEQTFGLRKSASDFYKLPEDDIAIKCGWFIDEDIHRIRTHAVLIIRQGFEHSLCYVILSSLPIRDLEIRQYKNTYTEGAEVLGIHDMYAGEILRAEAMRLFRETYLG